MLFAGVPKEIFGGKTAGSVFSVSSIASSMNWLTALEDFFLGLDCWAGAEVDGAENAGKAEGLGANEAGVEVDGAGAVDVLFSGFHFADAAACSRYLAYCSCREGRATVRSRNSLALSVLDRNERNETFRPRRAV